MFGVVGMEQKFPMEQGWLLCRETGGRAELTMEVPGGSRGLYRGYVLGAVSYTHLTLPTIA